MQRPKFPDYIDSTILAAFRSCPRRCYLQYFEHWKPKVSSVHLHAGGAFAYGLEMARKAFYEKGVDQTTAEAVGVRACTKFYGDFQCPPESAKSLERTVGALEFYFSTYPFSTDYLKPATIQDRLAIEFSFAEPIPGSWNPETNAPMLYTGRSDLIGEMDHSMYIVDEKTCSQLGATWGDQWELRSQFTGYVWAAHAAGLPVKGAVVRGISILKTKYDTLEKITYRGAWEIERWLKQVTNDLKRMNQCWESGWWDYSLDNACTEYGGCLFKQICKSPDPEAWLEIGFTRRIWDPVSRTEKDVDQPPFDDLAKASAEAEYEGGDAGIMEMLRQQRDRA